MAVPNSRATRGIHTLFFILFLLFSLIIAKGKRASQPIENDSLSQFVVTKKALPPPAMPPASPRISSSPGENTIFSSYAERQTSQDIRPARRRKKRAAAKPFRRSAIARAPPAAYPSRIHRRTGRSSPQERSAESDIIAWRITPRGTASPIPPRTFRGNARRGRAPFHT